jgi:hypothetical protein
MVLFIETGLVVWWPECLRHIISVNLCPWARRVPWRHSWTHRNHPISPGLVLSQYTGTLPCSIHTETQLCAYLLYVCVPDQDSFLDITSHQVPIRGSRTIFFDFVTSWGGVHWVRMVRQSAGCRIEDVRQRRCRTFCERWGKSGEGTCLRHENLWSSSGHPQFRGRFRYPIHPRNRIGVLPGSIRLHESRRTSHVDHPWRLERRGT